MVYVYSAYVQTNFLIGTDQLAIEIDAPANTTLKITQINVSIGDGTATASSDFYRKVKIVTESAAGTGGTSYTPAALDANQPASASTVTVNNGAFAVGTIANTIDVNSQHSTNSFVWRAVDEDDKIVVAAGGIFGVVLNTAA
jgi:hypothetical protein